MSSEIARPLTAAVEIAAVLETRIAEAMTAPPRSPLVVGLCGSQGSGKSTVAALLVDALHGRGWRVLPFSLDDLYHTHATRRKLAREVHPFFATRGVPGTHELEIGGRLIEQAASDAEIAVPVFDKAQDDRLPEARWPRLRGPMDIVLIEGWCIGALPEAEERLKTPINGLEREGDRDGSWRRHVNDALKGRYGAFNARIDLLLMLAAPAFEVVAGWRKQQEHRLKERLHRDNQTGSRVMSDAEIDLFVQHYERITRHILDEMPARADLTVLLDSERRPLRYLRNSPARI